LEFTALAVSSPFCKAAGPEDIAEAANSNGTGTHISLAGPAAIEDQGLPCHITSGVADQVFNRCRMSGSATRVIAALPFSITSITSLYFSGGNCSSGATCWRPASLIRIPTS